jgi:hypothetical protein
MAAPGISHLLTQAMGCFAQGFCQFDFRMGHNLKFRKNKTNDPEPQKGFSLIVDSRPMAVRNPEN